MKRIVLKPLKSRKQLKGCSNKRVVSAGFTDENEKYFNISFEMEKGMKQDIKVIFETRTPRIYLSDCYAE